MASAEVLIGVVVGTIVGLVLSALIIVFLLFWLGFCHCPGADDALHDDEDDNNVAGGEGNSAAARQRQYKGIPLNTVVRPLSAAEQEERDRVIARYKRRKAREERRAQRQQRREARAAARAAAAANGLTTTSPVVIEDEDGVKRTGVEGRREGEGPASLLAAAGREHTALHASREEANNNNHHTITANRDTNNMHSNDAADAYHVGANALTRRSSLASTMNTLTTTTATTALTSSAVAYGRGEYLPYDEDEDEEMNNSKYYHGEGSQRSSHACRPRPRPHHRSHGTHDAGESETEMVPVSGRASSCGRHSSASRHTLATLRSYMRELGRQRRLRRRGRRRQTQSRNGDGEVDILNQWETSLGRSSSSSSSSLTSSSSSSDASVDRRSIASSMPRPPEEILGRNAFTARYHAAAVGAHEHTNTTTNTNTAAAHDKHKKKGSNSRGGSNEQQQQPHMVAQKTEKKSNDHNSHVTAAAAGLHSSSTPASHEPTHDSEAEEMPVRGTGHHHHHQQQPAAAAAALVLPQPPQQTREAEHVYYTTHMSPSQTQQPQQQQSSLLPSLWQPTNTTAAAAAAAGGPQYDAYLADLTHSSAFAPHARSEQDEKEDSGRHAGQQQSTNTTTPDAKKKKKAEKDGEEGAEDDNESSGSGSSILVLGHRPSASPTSHTPAAGRYTSSGGSGGTGDHEPHTGSHTAAAAAPNTFSNNNATVDVRKRKWTGRDVEQNVALSGFFAAPVQNSLELLPRPRRASVLHTTHDITTITTNSNAVGASGYGSTAAATAMGGQVVIQPAQTATTAAALAQSAQRSADVHGTTAGGGRGSEAVSGGGSALTGAAAIGAAASAKEKVKKAATTAEGKNMAYNQRILDGYRAALQLHYGPTSAHPSSAQHTTLAAAASNEGDEPRTSDAVREELVGRPFRSRTCPYCNGLRDATPKFIHPSTKPATPQAFWRHVLCDKYRSVQSPWAKYNLQLRLVPSSPLYDDSREGDDGSTCEKKNNNDNNAANDTLREAAGQADEQTARHEAADLHDTPYGGVKMFVVGPMVDQSELPFRMLCREYGATLAFTPMLHAKSYRESALYRRRHFTTSSPAEVKAALRRARQRERERQKRRKSRAQHDAARIYNATITTNSTSSSSEEDEYDEESEEEEKLLVDRPCIVQFCGNDPDTILAAARLAVRGGGDGESMHDEAYYDDDDDEGNEEEEGGDDEIVVRMCDASQAGGSEACAKEQHSNDDDDGRHTHTPRASDNKQAGRAERYYYCDAVDLNLGCPQGIARRGHYGAYLMEDWELIHTIIHTLHVELEVPVTAKIRVFDQPPSTGTNPSNTTGGGGGGGISSHATTTTTTTAWLPSFSHAHKAACHDVNDGDDAEDGAKGGGACGDEAVHYDEALTIAYAKMIRDAGAQLLTVHGRTRAMKGQQTGLANLALIARLHAALQGSLPLLSNGNVLCYEDVGRALRAARCEGHMCAEALLWDPTLFAQPTFLVPSKRKGRADKATRLCALSKARHYLAWLQRYPVDMGCVKAHLYKMCFHSYELHPAQREALTRLAMHEPQAATAVATRRVCSDEHAENNTTNTNTNTDTSSTSDSNNAAAARTSNVRGAEGIVAADVASQPPHNEQQQQQQQQGGDDEDEHALASAAEMQLLGPSQLEALVQHLRAVYEVELHCDVDLPPVRPAKEKPVDVFAEEESFGIDF